MKRPFINLEEKIEKVVGRRTETPDAWESAMKLQALAVQLHVSLKHRWARKAFIVSKPTRKPTNG